MGGDRLWKTRRISSRFLAHPGTCWSATSSTLTPPILWKGSLLRLISSPRSQAGNNLGDFVSIAIEQVILTDERVLDFAGELEPLLARPRAEVAERTDRLLAWPFRRHHGLDQHVVGVGLAVIGATRFADVHVAPRITRVSKCCTTNHNYCRTATDIFLIFSHYFE